mmetsp:Transcript_11447/g.15605  ORF Transcript_11447/g.15605 Transcript_11447/m.15605 type:complete len:576 (+) Transcript_11447:557-2284(+)|eukprot:CAMPEP_0196585320 /NCGR_PEP_ID=MMETSP1081-20130531/50245_1 /TAXON_ID=36882 /ORGANISM="Pyramimonas amylifera, Strain CCMP720" /LENGTH=575 /DNA_ID=CAMNT_0041906831 /DNA_START=472 /DNA_END=2199 /DNA_ORIENTATION=-
MNQDYLYLCDEYERVCKICYEDEEEKGEEESGALVSPCACRGSARLVHVSCLKRWHAHEGYPPDLLCKTCNTPYSGAVAVELARMNLEAAVGARGYRDAGVAEALTQLGSLLQGQGLYDDAEQLLRQSLEIDTKLCGVVHPTVASDLVRLGDLYSVRGLPHKAEPLQKRALNIRRTVLGPSHFAVAESLTKLASLEALQEKFDRALDMFQRALQILERLGPSEPLEVAKVLTLSAQIHRVRGEYERATSLLERALGLTVGVRGDMDMDSIRAREALAELAAARGQEEQAEAGFLQLLVDKEAASGGHRGEEYARTLCSLGKLRCQQCRCEEGLALCQQSLDILEAQNVPNYLALAHMFRAKASMLVQFDKPEDAELSLRRCLEMTENARGPGHPDVAGVLDELATLLAQADEGCLKTQEKAVEMKQRVLAIQESHLGGEHPKVAEALESLAILMCLQDRHELALPLYQRSLAIKEKVFGVDHSLVVNTLNKLSDLLKSQGRVEEAGVLMQRAHTIISERKAPTTDMPPKPVQTILQELQEPPKPLQLPHEETRLSHRAVPRRRIFCCCFDMGPAI